MKTMRTAMMAAVAAPNQAWVKSLAAEAGKSAKLAKRQAKVTQAQAMRRYLEPAAPPTDSLLGCSLGNYPDYPEQRSSQTS